MQIYESMNLCHQSIFLTALGSKSHLLKNNNQKTLIIYESSYQELADNKQKSSSFFDFTISKMIILIKMQTFLMLSLLYLATMGI